jgi:hypothetical protein
LIRVGLARTQPDYEGLAPPFGPGKNFPELAALLGPEAGAGPTNHVYAAVRSALYALGWMPNASAARTGTPWAPSRRAARASC